MSEKSIEGFKDPILAKKILSEIFRISKRNVKIMEVCGTHTVSIFRNGIKSLLPKTISLCSGPGCPVCVTSQAEIDAFIELSKKENVIIATFGDLIRVPGSCSSLQKQQVNGADIRVVYSTFDALTIAQDNPTKKVIFIGIGFETTAPTIAASILQAEQKKINNFYVISAHKTVPPALEALVSLDRVNVDGFILPGHVSAIIGVDSYKNFVKKNRISCVIAGFECIDILEAIYMLILMLESGKYKLKNGYSRVVNSKGNRKAIDMMSEVFKSGDARWRGIGNIAKSGLIIRDRYSKYDAYKIFGIKYKKYSIPLGCICGEVLVGRKSPLQCSLYKNKCTPIYPVGPCMVSTEGTCAAYYNYSL